MKRFSLCVVFLVAGLSAGVLTRYAAEQAIALRSPQIAQVAVPFNAQPRNWNSPGELYTLNPRPYTLVFVGDIMLARGVAYHVAKQGGNPRHPFLKIAHTLRSADFTFGNLEGPISSRGVNQGSIYSFRADPRVIEGLTYAGFDALSLANNHIFDWGQVAIEDTINVLRANNIRPVGAGMNYDDANAARIVTVGDATLAIFAYTNLYPVTLRAMSGVGISDFMFANIHDRIRAIREKTDVVVVSLHWGTEYAPQPTLQQRKLARSLVDAGADLVIGHHPHVVQEVEQYKDGWIAYSLGNFVFDQGFSEETMRGAIAEVTVKNKRIANVRMIPTRMTQTFQPEAVVP